MRNIPINIGDKKNRLTFIKELSQFNNDRYGLFLCECGNYKETKVRAVRESTTKSCGCLSRELSTARLNNYNKTHGMCGNTPLYHVFKSMKSRCYRERDKAYQHYGGRGISICDQWLNGFINFYNWAINNGYSNGLQIDRIDVNKGYSPENCRWVTYKVNSNNKRNTVYVEYNGEKITLRDLCELSKIHRSTLVKRIFTHGLSANEAVEIGNYKLRELNKIK